MALQRRITLGQVCVRQKGDSRCAKHRTKEVQIYCLDCDELICISCSISTHNGHSQKELDEIIPQKRAELQSVISETERITLHQLKHNI